MAIDELAASLQKSRDEAANAAGGVAHGQLGHDIETFKLIT